MEFCESVRANTAKKYFTEGYNCAQAVALAFEDILPLDKEGILLMSSPFGGGMGRMREVCGAVSGMFMVLGAKNGYSAPDDMEGKKRIYAEVRALADEFKAEFGSIICRELLEGVQTTTGGDPEKRSEAYYHKRPCGEQVAYCAYLLEKHLNNKGDI